MIHTKPNEGCSTLPVDMAVTLAAHGMHVFQIWGITDSGFCGCPRFGDCKSPGKHPIRAGSFKEATIDPRAILRFAAERPDAQWAIACEASGITVLDVDYRHNGKSNLDAWEAVHGTLPVTFKVKTGNGFHLYFRRPTQGIRNSASKVAPGLDIRGDGGYVVAPNSRHASGANYEFEGGIEGLHSLAEMPRALQLAVPAPSPSDCSDNMRSQKYGTVIKEGCRNGTLASLAGKVRREGCDQKAIEAALQATNDARCLPALAREEVTAIATSIVRYDPANEGERLNTLARLSTIDYQRCRKDEAKALGIGVAALDDEVKHRRQAVGSAAEDVALIPPIEPWPKEVDGKFLLDCIVRILL